MIVVFDAYGTLFNLTDPVVSVLGDGPAARSIAERWRARQIEFAWADMLTGATPDFWSATERGAYAAVSGLDVDVQQLLDAYRSVPAFGDAHQCIVALTYAGVDAYIYSNATPGMLKAGIAASGLMIPNERAISTLDSGVFKPHPEAYRFLLEQVRLPARQVLFVSSNAWDIAGAAAAGCETCWVNRDAAPFPYPHTTPSEIVASLTELTSLPGLATEQGAQ